MRVTFIAALLMLGLTSAGYAQQSGTPDDERACAPSVKRFCVRSIAGGDLAVLACLQANRNRIAASCQRVLTNYGQ